MPKDKQPPIVVLNQPSQDDETDHVPTLESITPRVGISRSNSAPQAQNRFSTSRLGLKSKAGSPKNSPKRQVQTGEQSIPTLSDGLIHVNQEQAAQAAANVLVSQGPSSGPSSDNSLVSSTPLCDSNHSPSSTKRYYQEASPMFGQEPTTEDVWQRREKFSSSGKSKSIGSDSNGNLLGNHVFTYPQVQPTEGVTSINGSQVSTDRSDHLCDGAGGEVLATTSPTTSAGDEILPNGLSKMRNSQESNEGDLAVGTGQSQALREMEKADRVVDLRSGHQRYPFRQAQSEVLLPSETHRRVSLANMKEKGYARMEEELLKAQKALEMKDEEVDELRGIRERLMKEVSDFTASLFEEVNSQLNEAAINEQQAKKQLKEANAKIEVLTAEVAALKDLVLTSTPSSPNKHLHPQIDTTNKKEKGGKPFWKTHRRSTSHHQYTKESREKAEATEHHAQLKELDTVAFDEFSRWRLQPTMEFTGQYFTRVQMEDIQPCLNFKNTRLAERLAESVKQNTLSIEPIPGDHSFPRKCSLSETHKLCNFKIKFEGDDDWYSISQMSRNRIAAVCDFYAYLRYIVQGLVKCSDKDMYAELVRLRSHMGQARLGLI